MSASPHVNHLAVRHSKSIRNLRGTNQLIYVDTTTHRGDVSPECPPGIRSRTEAALPVG